MLEYEKVTNDWKKNIIISLVSGLVGAGMVKDGRQE